MPLNQQTVFHSVIVVCILIFLCFTVQEIGKSRFEVCAGAEDPSECIETLTESTARLDQIKRNLRTPSEQCMGIPDAEQKAACIRGIVEANLEAVSYTHCDCTCPSGYGNNRSASE